MKSIFTLTICVLCHALAFGQAPCPTDIPYKETAYTLLKNLDKSQIPTGILYENVFPIANIFEYTGNSNTDTTSNDHFLQAYSEIYLSKFNNTGLKHYFDLIDDVDNFNANSKYYHPIGIIDYDYNTIDPNAINNNLLSLSNQQLYDVPNRPNSPYVAQKAVIASILTTENYPCLFAGQHYFTFNSNFVLANSGFNLSQVTYLQAIYNGSTIYNSAVAGLENFTLPLTVGNADQGSNLVLILTVNGVQKYYIISICQVATDPITTCRGQDKIEITGFPFDGGYGEGLYSEKGVAHIYYGNNNCADKKLRKPIIFVDGFDPNNKQTHEIIWSKYLNSAFVEGNNPSSRLGNELLGLDYDIIILDQKKGDDKNYNRGGAGLVENNGLVLAKLLDSLYTLHSSTMTQDFVVVGASMGGLVSRFGLAWMEANNKPHHTRLFISFDSPQNGAQIPIGLQQMVDKFTQYGGLTLFPSVKNSLHQSNAAKQMLLHHSSRESESMQANEFRTIFLNNLTTVGNWPTQCRMVAISDGNRIGTKKNIPITPPNGDTPPAIDDRYLEADFGIKQKRLQFCNANLCYKLHTQLYAQTASSRYKTNVFTVNSTNLILLAAAGFPTPFFSKTEYALAENGTSFDIAPGSRLRQNPLEKATGNIGKSNVPIPVVAAIVVGPIKISSNILMHSNFIPTISSVAYTFPNNEPFSVYKNLQNVVLRKCAGTTPFDTAYAPSYDLPHVSIDEYIANSFRNEVYFQRQKSVCSGACPDFIVSSAQIPSATTEIYKASKSITLTPGFKANGSSNTVFKAQIGCANLTTSNDVKKEYLPVSLLSTCLFNWNPAKNEVLCGGGFSTFKAFVKNYGSDTYAEFSTNGSTWFRANISDDGYQIIVNSNPGQAQVFFARPHNNPSNVIQGWLGHCN